MLPSVPTPEEVLRARVQIGNAIRFLRGGRDDELHLIEANLSFEMGALHAIDWMLGLNGGQWFQRHLAALAQIEPGLVEGVSDGGPRDPRRSRQVPGVRPGH